MATAYFFVGNSLIASGDLPPQVRERAGHLDTLDNRAYFCPACGEIWGRIHLRPEKDYSLCHRYCAAHGSGLFQDNSSPMWEHYPKEVLKRELALIAYHLERNPSLDWLDLVINWKKYYD